MDAVGERRVVQAEHEARKTVRYVPMSIYEEQMSGGSLRDEFAKMFESSGPWMFRDSIGGPEEGDDSLAQRFSEMQRARKNLAASPDEILADRAAGLASSDDPVFEGYSRVPRDHSERVAARARRAEARRQRRAG
eukprot:jgi/Tetstr1/454001/TSEL_040920.t1